MITPDQVTPIGSKHPLYDEQFRALERATDRAIRHADRTGNWPAVVARRSSAALASAASDVPDDDTPGSVIYDVAKMYTEAGWKVEDNWAGAFLAVWRKAAP